MCRDSKLTHLLVDVLGGNSVTHVLCTFKPESNTVADTVMCIAKELAQIDNFPIENTEDAKVASLYLFVASLLSFTFVSNAEAVSSV